MKIKLFCYFVLIVAFLTFYQKDTVFTLVIVALAAGGYLYFKLKKRGNISSNKKNPSVSKTNNLYDLIMAQQLLRDNGLEMGTNNIQKNKVKNIEAKKKEIRDLFEEF